MARAHGAIPTDVLTRTTHAGELLPARKCGGFRADKSFAAFDDYSVNPGGRVSEIFRVLFGPFFQFLFHGGDFSPAHSTSGRPSTWHACECRFPTRHAPLSEVLACRRSLLVPSTWITRYGKRVDLAVPESRICSA